MPLKIRFSPPFGGNLVGMQWWLLRRVRGLRVLEHCKISNPKHQITNKSQIAIFNDQNKKQVSNFEFWSL